MARRYWVCQSCQQTLVDPVFECARCGTTPAELQWMLSTVESMARFSAFFGLAPFGPHRQLIAELWPGASCPDCAATGLERPTLEPTSTPCATCGGRGYRQPPGAIPLRELQRRVRLAYPDAAPNSPAPWPLWSARSSGARPRPTHYSKFLGALLGTTCGDAMGVPVEGQPPSAGVRHAQRLGPVWHRTAARSTSAAAPDLTGVFQGRYSDDGQQARVLVEVLAAHGRADEDDFASRLQTIVGSQRQYGWGHGTLAAVRRMRSGVHWRDAAAPVGRCGNGSAMRVVPLGVWHAHETDDVVAAAAARQSRVTHADPRSTAAAVAVALAAADTARGLSARELLARTAAWAEYVGPYDDRLACGLHAMRERFYMSREEAVGWAVQHGPDLQSPYQGVPGVAAPTALFVLWCWLRLPWHFSSSVLDAIAAGGDTDTTAAIVGGLVGATAGPNALPTVLTDRLHDARRWTAHDLTALCEQAWQRHVSVNVPPVDSADSLGRD